MAQSDHIKLWSVFIHSLIFDVKFGTSFIHSFLPFKVNISPRFHPCQRRRGIRTCWNSKQTQKATWFWTSYKFSREKPKLVAIYIFCFKKIGHKKIRTILIEVTEHHNKSVANLVFKKNGALVFFCIKNKQILWKCITFYIFFIFMG